MGDDTVKIEIDRIIRSKRRKTIALQITDEAKLVVRAPFNVSDETIRKVIIKHKKWIENKLNLLKSRDPKPSKKEFANGEGFLYLGRNYKLRIVETQSEPLIFENGFYLHKRYLPKAREIFIGWYKEKAYEKIKERVEFYAEKGGFKYNKINITNAQKRWGSCSQNNNLNFSWRLIMAPLSVIDYVVVHELVHTQEKNHNRMFSTKVRTILPDYEKYNDWLKKNGYLLKLNV